MNFFRRLLLTVAVLGTHSCGVVTAQTPPAGAVGLNVKNSGTGTGTTPVWVAKEPGKAIGWDAEGNLEAIPVGGGTGGPATWGNIGGTLADQLDLQSALNAKLSVTTAASTYVSLSGFYADPPWITSLSKAKVSLGNVENTALSTWAGSSNITALGTIASGTVPVARVSGLAASATSDTTNAGNITSGTLPAGRIGNGSIASTKLTASGVAAGSYPEGSQFQVNAQGQVISALARQDTGYHNTVPRFVDSFGGGGSAHGIDLLYIDDPFGSPIETHMRIVSTLGDPDREFFLPSQGGVFALTSQIPVAGIDYLTPNGNGSGLTSLNASAISSGTLSSARLPTPTTVALGGVKRNTGAAGEFVTGIDADGNLLYATPAGGGGGTKNWTLLSTVTLSGNTAVNVTGLNAATHRKYLIEFRDVTCSANGYELRLRTSTNGGSSYDTGASDYDWGWSSVGVYLETRGSNDHCKLSYTTRNTVGDGLTGEMIFWPSDGTSKSNYKFEFGENDYNSASMRGIHGFGRRNDTTAVDALQFFFSNGNNLATGKIFIFGWND